MGAVGREDERLHLMSVFEREACVFVCVVQPPSRLSSVQWNLIRGGGSQHQRQHQGFIKESVSDGLFSPFCYSPLGHTFYKIIDMDTHTHSYILNHTSVIACILYELLLSY